MPPTGSPAPAPAALHPHPFAPSHAAGEHLAHAHAAEPHETLVHGHHARPVVTPHALDALAAVLRHRPGRPADAGTVTVTSPPARSCYLALLRVSGPRDAVLDHVAWLLADAAAPAGGHGPYELEAVERDDGERLALLLSRVAYLG